MSAAARRFVVACPFRSSADYFARALVHRQMLRAYFLATRRGTDGIPSELTHLNPLLGLFQVVPPMFLSPYWSEWVRTSMHPLYDRWVEANLVPGDCVFSSLGFANRSFKKARKNGGVTFFEAGNSHPEQFREIVGEEHRRWGCPLPPMPPHWSQRGLRMLEHSDYIVAPSTYVTQSFLKRGFVPERILQIPYPVDLGLFQPAPEIPTGPLRVICTGSVSLRKGSPYLFEAMRIVQKHRDAILMLSDNVESSMRPLLSRFSDVTVEWTPGRPHHQVPALLAKAHVFALLSLEEGMARTGLEAVACGLPVVVTPHSGINDCVLPGITGELVPIRDPQAAAAAILTCHDRLLAGGRPPRGNLGEWLAPQMFENRFIGHLQRLGLTPDPA